MTQRDVDAMLSRVLGEARALGIPVSSRVRPQVELNGRARTRFGCCIRREGGYIIQLSARMLKTDEFAVRQVLAHEVLHTCPGCADHGPRWRAYAARMNAAYGYAVRRTSTCAELGLPDDRPVRYWVVCEACGNRIPRMKRSPLVDRPERYRCRCGGRLHVEAAAPL